MGLLLYYIFIQVYWTMLAQHRTEMALEHCVDIDDEDDDAEWGEEEIEEAGQEKGLGKRKSGRVKCSRKVGHCFIFIF